MRYAGEPADIPSRSDALQWQPSRELLPTSAQLGRSRSPVLLELIEGIDKLLAASSYQPPKPKARSSPLGRRL